MKVEIFAPSMRHAAGLAAQMNLRARQWVWTGDNAYVGIVWADVGSVLDAYEEEVGAL